MHIRFSSTRLQILFATVLLPALAGTVDAAEPVPGWLQTRDSNPFALATGLPLAPAVPPAGAWQIDVSLSIANTELQQFGANSSLLFDAETHETRLNAAYALDPHWTVRASISHLWIGAGFLDGPVERFHRAFGFDNGDRGLLTTQAPEVEVRRDGEILYALERGQSGAGPLLLDLTRSWELGGGGIVGFSLGTKLSTGSRSRLSDSDSTDLSLAAFALLPLGERFSVGIRGGVLGQGDNRLLGDSAHDAVPFASVMARYRLGQKWSAILQSDAHAALYRDLPAYLGGAANQLNFGLVRRVGDIGEFQATLAEDLPALHTSDVAINLNLRLNLGH